MTRHMPRDTVREEVGMHGKMAGKDECASMCAVLRRGDNRDDISTVKCGR